MEIFNVFLLLLLLARSAPLEARSDDDDDDYDDSEEDDPSPGEVDLDSWRAPKEMYRNNPYFLSGFDKENRPVFVIQAGIFEFRKYVNRGGNDLRAFEKYIEQTIHRVSRGPPKDLYPGGEKPANKGSVLLIDTQGLNYWHLASPGTLRLLTKMAGLMASVQETIDYGYIFNLNTVGHALVSILRPVLGKLLTRMETHGTNSAQWKRAMARKIPENQLPESYGGVRGFVPALTYT